MNTFTYPEKLHPGDKVAIISPSSGLPEIFPAVYEQGLQRLQDIFKLELVEYPTTRKMNSAPEARAHDIHAAFSDPEIKGIIATIGGEDQIKVLKYLHPELIKAHPKPFFGYSDNTNLHLFLWNLGIVSYYGGSIMVHFGRPGAMHPYSLDSLKRALFTRGEVEILPSSEFNDEDSDWNDPEKLKVQPSMFPNTGWKWLNEGSVVEGITWGGCLEIIDWNLKANKHILAEETYAGKILYLETSEEMPSATEVYRTLMCMGERGLLEQFAAVLVARPKAWFFDKPNTPEQKEQFIKDQEEAIKRALSEYNPHVPVVFNLDFGHTDPQLILPNGGYVRIDSVQRRIYVTY